MKYAHYNKTTGKLLGWYDKEIHSNIPEPKIEMSDEDWQVAINNNYNYVDVTTKTLSYKDFRKLVELRTAKIQEIVAEYSKANGEDIKFKDKLFTAKESDRNLLAQVLSVGSVPKGFYWRAKDNTNVPMSYINVQQLGGLLLSRGQKNFDKLQTLKAKVKAAKSKSALEKIKW